MEQDLDFFLFQLQHTDMQFFDMGFNILTCVFLFGFQHTHMHLFVCQSLWLERRKEYNLGKRGKMKKELK